MGKIMTTGDMYNWAKEHPGARFMRGMNDFVYHFEENRLYFINRDGITKPCDVFPKLNDQWELIPEAVDFVTAANSVKRVHCDYWDKGVYRHLWEENIIRLTKSEINGKWYIEE